MSKIKKEVIEGGWINADEEITVKYFGDIIKIKSNSSKQTHLKNYQKLSGKSYLNKTTNIEHEYKQNENKTVKNVSRSVNEIKDIVLNNFQGHQNILFLTLTCTKAVMDFEFMKKNFDNFFRKLKRRYGDLKYFYIIELQKNRKEPSLHIHSAIKSIEHKRFTIPDDETTRLWGVGFCTTERLNNAEKLTSYFVKDLLDEANLKIYPKNSNLYYCSLGLPKPKEETMIMQEFLNKCADDFYRDNGVIINIVDEDTAKIINGYMKQLYKRRKHKKKNIHKIRRTVRFRRLQGNLLICDDIYENKKQKYYGATITVNTKNTVLLNKVQNLRKYKKAYLLLKGKFPIKRDLSNMEVIDVLDKENIKIQYLF